MTRNPFINAAAALLYIIIVASSMFYGTQKMSHEDSVIAPIAALSLFTLSVAVMAFLFFYQPLLLFIEGKKKEAVNLFVKTVGIFAVITTVVLILLFSGVLN